MSKNVNKYIQHECDVQLLEIDLCQKWSIAWYGDDKYLVMNILPVGTVVATPNKERAM